MATLTKILFLCTGNSSRSIMAEAITNYFGHGHYHAYSAGSFPAGEVHPKALEILKRHGISSNKPRSKSSNIGSV